MWKRRKNYIKYLSFIIWKITNQNKSVFFQPGKVAIFQGQIDTAERPQSPPSLLLSSPTPRAWLLPFASSLFSMP